MTNQWKWKQFQHNLFVQRAYIAIVMLFKLNLLNTTLGLKRYLHVSQWSWYIWLQSNYNFLPKKKNSGKEKKIEALVNYNTYELC